MAAMTPEQRDAFLGETRIGKLATLNEEGAPTVIPIWYDWDGECAWVFSSRTVQKVRNIERDDRVSLTVENPVGAPEAWVTIEGHAEVLPEGGYALASKLAPRYYPAEKAARTLEEWGKLGEQYWALIKIAPSRIRSTAPH